MSALDQYIRDGVYEFTDFGDLNDEEKKMIWEWRNDESIRQWMNNRNLIAFEAHLEFLNRLKTDQTKKYWLVKRKGEYLGVYSIINLNELEGESGYYIAPRYHDQNLGTEFCYFTFSYIFNVVGIKKLYGHALVTNKGANSLSRLFGFSEKLITKSIDNKNYDFYYGELTREEWFDKIENSRKIERLVLFSISK